MQTIIPSKTLLNRIMILASLCWIIFVAIRYIGVDYNFLPAFLTQLPQEFILGLILGSSYFSVIGVWLGYTWAKEFRFRNFLGVSILFSIAYFALTNISSIHAIGLGINNLSDRFRASLVIIWALVFGIGLGMGFQRAKRYPSLASVTILIILLFLGISALANALPQLFVFVCLFFVADAIGWATLQILNRWMPQASELNRAGVLTIALGLSILSPSVLFLGLLGQVSKTSLIVFLIGLIFLCFPRIWWMIRYCARLDWQQIVTATPLSTGAWAMLIALFAMFWVGALAPETGPDALGFRIAGPVIWMRDGNIHPLPEMLGSYGFFAGEMLYLLVMPLAGTVAAKVVTFGLGVLMVLGTFTQIPSLRHNREFALWFFAFWGSTITWWQMIAGFVDLTQTFFYFGVFLAQSFWLEDSNKTWLAVAGILGGMATVIKLNGVGAIAISGLITVAVVFSRKRSLRLAIASSLWIAIPAIFIILPWVARSYVLTGNPVFPFANTIFQSSLAPLETIAIKYGPGLKFPDILRVPWDVFSQPGRFTELGTYHPFLLAIAPLALIGFIGAQRRDLFWLGSAVLSGALWLVTEQNLRYSLYAGYLVSVVFAIGLMRLGQSTVIPWLSCLGRSSAIIMIAIGFTIQLFRPASWMWGPNSAPGFPSKVVFGEQSQSEYLASFTPTFTCAEWLNRNYGTQAKVWQVQFIRDHLNFQAQVFSLPHGILPIVQPLWQILNDSTWINNPAIIYSRLREIGFTHILYSTVLPPLVEIPIDQRGGIYSPSFERAYLQIECADRGVELYRIRAIPALPAAVSNQSNLLQNPQWESASSNHDLMRWNTNGRPQIILSHGNNLLHLESGESISQAVPVHEDTLYEFEVQARTDAKQVGYVQINWLDYAGRLRLSSKVAIMHSGIFGRARIRQMSPMGAGTAVITLQGGPVDVQNPKFSEIEP